MAQHPIRIAAAAEAGLVTDTLLEASVKRNVYVLNVGESLGDLDFDVGEPPLAVAFAATGYLYFYDSTDSTTADDGLTCLVSGNGLRYHIEDSAAISLNSVLSFETAPPGSPVAGDVHIVNAAATGAFSGHDDDLAVYTRRGWVYATPEIGHTVLNEDDDANWQFTASGWTGFAVAFADGSIGAPALAWPAGLAVESTENTPPGSPTVGPYWIVGSVPTGAYVGHGGDLAHWTGSAWAFIDAYEGATVFHKDFGFSVSYVSGAWLGEAGSEVQTFSTAGAATWTKPAKGTRAFVQVWGAGASGGRAGTTDAGGGGGGGDYNEWWFDLADLGATETVTVGGGGPSQTVDESNGVAGGNSSFGSHLVAYGGGGGTGATANSGSGGGGGGVAGAGASTSSSAVGGNGGTGAIAGTGGGAQAGLGGTSAAGSDSIYGGGGGGGGGAISAGGKSVWGGGGGGGNTTANGGDGGSSWYGGGGGGSSGTSVSGSGGTSKFGGAGGAGGGGSGTAGAQPGGGGGGSSTGNSGKGGDGLVRVTVV